MLRTWLDAQLLTLSTVPDQSFAASHLDEILGEGWPRAVADAVAVLPRLHEAGGARLLGHGVRLALPLDSSDDLDTDLPDIGEVKVGLEPPSIYIFRPDHWLRPSDWEEYRCPASPSPWGDAYFVEYSCGRSLSERAAGWDFVRTLWVRWIGGTGGQ